MFNSRLCLRIKTSHGLYTIFIWQNRTYFIVSSIGLGYNYLPLSIGKIRIWIFFSLLRMGNLNLKKNLWLYGTYNTKPINIWFRQFFKYCSIFQVSLLWAHSKRILLYLLNFSAEFTIARTQINILTSDFSST